MSIGVSLVATLLRFHFRLAWYLWKKITSYPPNHIVPLAIYRGRRGRARDRMAIEYSAQVPMQSVPITTYVNVVSSNPAHGEVYSIQHYVIKFVGDLWQVCGLSMYVALNTTNPPPLELRTRYVMLT